MNIINPNYSSAYLWKGHIYSDLKMRDNAIMNFEKAIELGESDVKKYIDELNEEK